jgi:transposase
MIGHDKDCSVPMSGDRSSRSFNIVAETRRQWSKAEKEAVVAEAAAPDVNVSAVARRHGVSPSLLFRWIKIHGPCRDGGPTPAPPAFLPVSLPSPNAIETSQASSKRKRLSRAASVFPEGRIEIELGNGRLLRVDAGIDIAMLKRLIDVLEA